MKDQVFDKTEMIILRNQGLTNREIAEKLGCGYSTVCAKIGGTYKRKVKTHIVIQKPIQEKALTPTRVSEMLAFGEYVVQIRWFDDVILLTKKDDPDHFISIKEDQIDEIKQVLDMAKLYKEGVLTIG